MFLLMTPAFERKTLLSIDADFNAPTQLHEQEQIRSVNKAELESVTDS